MPATERPLYLAAMSNDARSAFSRRTMIIGLAILPSAAHAHHGFGGRYDASRPVWLAGRVVRGSFSPPHPVLTVAVRYAGARLLPNPLPAELGGAPTVSPDLDGRTVEVEFPPVQAFFRLGERVAAGAEVEIIALRNCQPPHQLRSQWLRLTDGVVIARDGRLSYMTSGCS